MHSLSPRQDKKLVVINCGTLPQQLFESELFGYVQGAFTDAKKDKSGKLSQAEGGTVFFDEIGELPLSLRLSCGAPGMVRRQTLKGAGQVDTEGEFIKFRVGCAGAIKVRSYFAGQPAILGKLVYGFHVELHGAGLRGSGQAEHAAILQFVLKQHDAGIYRIGGCRTLTADRRFYNVEPYRRCYIEPISGIDERSNPDGMRGYFRILPGRIGFIGSLQSIIDGGIPDIAAVPDCEGLAGSDNPVAIIGELTFGGIVFLSGQIHGNQTIPGPGRPDGGGNAESIAIGGIAFLVKQIVFRKN
ncbi:MAG: sigma 54-interacting transcriptional regulator [Candidatus Zixiibacteriota bacterium]|nr:MAG: sigma 54-interacting transcriptional regulator [candidate division Zixibacteria bacterium]